MNRRDKTTFQEAAKRLGFLSTQDCKLRLEHLIERLNCIPPVFNLLKRIERTNTSQLGKVSATTRWNSPGEIFSATTDIGGSNSKKLFSGCGLKLSYVVQSKPQREGSVSFVFNHALGAGDININRFNEQAVTLSIFDEHGC